MQKRTYYCEKNIVPGQSIVGLREVTGGPWSDAAAWEPSSVVTSLRRQISFRQQPSKDCVYYARDVGINVALDSTSTILIPTHRGIRAKQSRAC